MLRAGCTSLMSDFGNRRTCRPADVRLRLALGPDLQQHLPGTGRCKGIGFGIQSLAVSADTSIGVGKSWLMRPRERPCAYFVKNSKVWAFEIPAWSGTGM